jgi:uncharacterized C2H2 Zn-finger protein
MFFEGGKIMALDCGSLMIPYNGRIEPLFQNVGYNIKKGFVSSTYFIDNSNTKAEIKEKEVPSTPSEILYSCPKCNGISKKRNGVICEICKGEGYISKKEIEIYTNANIREEEYFIQQINEEVLDRMNILTNNILETRNSLEMLGDTTPLLSEICDMLEDFEQYIIDIISGD